MAQAGDTIYAARDSGLGIAQLQRTTAQSIPNATQTAMSFDSAVLDRQGGWAASPNPTRFTPTLAGWYLVSGFVGYAQHATGNRQASVRKNGTTVPGGLAQWLPTGTGTSRDVTPTILVFMNGTTDYLELFAWQSSGAALNTTIGDGEPNMTVMYAGAA